MNVFASVTVDVTALKQIIKEIPNAITDGVKNVMVQHANQNFKTESFEGYIWQALKPRTLADRKAKGFPPGPILYRTGKLKRNHTITETNTGCIWDWKTPYASGHQFGVPARHLPARPFITGLGNASEDKKAVDELCAYITKKLNL